MLFCLNTSEKTTCVSHIFLVSKSLGLLKLKLTSLESLDLTLISQNFVAG